MSPILHASFLTVNTLASLAGLSKHTVYGAIRRAGVQPVRRSGGTGRPGLYAIADVPAVWRALRASGRLRLNGTGLDHLQFSIAMAEGDRAA